ncbi:MAG: Uma2 family endonuclease [Proteobacteria bacterium]|nr:Uma2 family endonuclease [Pseudomonadota bacterium]
MSSDTPSRSVYLAPGASSSAAAELPGASQPKFPPPDEHVVEPETYQEMIDGQIIQVAPSGPPHADRQFDIAYVLRANVADGYVGSTELLTRVSHDNDFATDACIRKQGIDADGHRHLEELSFEVKHTQSEASLDRRARYLLERGVRRVFVIHVRVDKRASTELVKAGPVAEWSAREDGWKTLKNASSIRDRCLRRPLKVKALLEAVEADNAVARGLIDKGNPVLQKLQTRSFDRGKSQGYDQGKSDGYDQGKSDGYDQGKSDGYDQGRSDGMARGIQAGLRQGIRALCQGLDIALTPAREARIDALDAEGLAALLRQLEKHRSWDNE